MWTWTTWTCGVLVLVLVRSRRESHGGRNLLSIGPRAEEARVAEAEIRLVVDPVTGKKNVFIKYASDEDALPMEHEEEHRRLVDRLLAGGALRASELGEIVIEREGSALASEDVAESEADPVAARRALEQKG